jgi:hypothetical protein
MSQQPKRTEVSLTTKDAAALADLGDNFDTMSISETIRRQIRPTSLLQRHIDEEGDIDTERKGRRYTIPPDTR